MVTCNCIDVKNPIQRSILRQRHWAEADAEFLRAMIINKANFNEAEAAAGFSFPTSPSFGSSSSSVCSEKPDIHRGFASRQKYLRSYPFSSVKKDQPNMKAWLQMMEKSAVLNIKVGARRSERSARLMFAAAGCLFSCVLAGKVDVVDKHNVNEGPPGNADLYL